MFNEPIAKNLPEKHQNRRNRLNVRWFSTPYRYIMEDILFA